MPFRNTSLSLKQKLVGIVFLTGVLAMCLAFVMLLYYETRSFRRATARDLSTTADIIAANSAAMLIFDDPKMAGQIFRACAPIRTSPPPRFLTRTENYSRPIRRTRLRPPFRRRPDRTESNSIRRN